MIRVVLLFLAVSLSPIRAEEMEIVSYYVGKGVSLEEFLWDWEVSQSDPFADLSLEELKATVVKSPQIQKPPFVSRFFGSKDYLFDVSGFFLQERRGGLPPIQAIFNQTSGRLVVRASQRDHVRIFENTVDQLDHSVLVALKIGIYEFPKQGIKGGPLHPFKIPESAVKLMELESKSRNGEPAAVKLPDFDLEWESHMSADRDYVDLRFNFSGAIHHGGKKHDFSLVTGMSIFSGIPKMMELGSLGSPDQTIVMAVTNSVELLDGTPYEELIIAEGDQRPIAEKRLESLRYRETPKIRDEKGKKFSTFIVPPTFINFIHPGEGADASNDPFEDPEEDRNHERYAHLLVSAKDRATYKERVGITNRLGARLYDLKKLLSNQGLLFEESDFAILNQKSGRLSALLSPTQMELLEAILVSGTFEPPRLIQTELTMLESNREFGMVDLDQGHIKRIARLVAHVRNGDKMTASLGLVDRSVLVDIESNVGAKDNILDVRLNFKLTEEKVPQLHIKSEVIFRSGQPKLIQKYRHEGKWRALLVRSEVRTLGDDLDE